MNIKLHYLVPDDLRLHLDIRKLLGRSVLYVITVLAGNWLGNCKDGNWTGHLSCVSGN